MPDTTLHATSVNRKWTLKIGVFALILLAFGVWGYYDAAVKYPERGAHAAETLEFRYLESYRELNRALDTKGASIEDPAAMLTELSTQEVKDLSPLDQTRRQWLEQLKIIGRLKPEHTRLPRDDFFKDGMSQGGRIPDATARHAALKNAPPGKPLSAFDIYMQWLIFVVGLAIGLYLTGLIVAVHRKVYRWDPGEKRLHLPSGDSIVPADIEEFDKRKWDKFIITLKIKQGHATLGGQTLTLDLLRYVPLEDWVLEMEREAFPESIEDQKVDAPATESKPATPGGENPTS